MTEMATSAEESQEAGPDPLNETQTIFRSDSISTEQQEDFTQDGSTNADSSNIPVRASIALKGPSENFNAAGPSFTNKTS